MLASGVLAAQYSRLGFLLSAVGTAFDRAGMKGVKFFTDSVKAARDYNLQTALTFTQVDELGVRLETIGKIGKRVAREIPAPFNQMQDALYDLFSGMDLRVGQSENMLRNISKAAVAGQADIRTAARQTIALMNAYQVPVKDVNKLLDFQFQLVRKGVGTYSDFASSIGKAIPAARAAGQHYETLGGMLIFMTRAGLSAAVSATSAARATELMARPQSVKNLRALGVAVEDSSGNLLQMDQIITQLAVNKGWAQMGSTQRREMFSQIFGTGSLQARRFFDLAIPNFDLLNTHMDYARNNAGALEEAFKIMAETPAMKLQLFQNAVAELRVEIGEKLLPTFTPAISALRTLVNWFTDLPKPIQQAVIWIGLVGSITLTATGKVIRFAGAVLRMYATVLLMKGISASAVAAGPVAGMGMIEGAAIKAAVGVRALWVSLLRITIIGAAIAAFVLLISKRFADFGRTVDDLSGKIQAGGTDIEDYTRKLFDQSTIMGRIRDEQRKGMEEFLRITGTWGERALKFLSSFDMAFRILNKETAEYVIAQRHADQAVRAHAAAYPHLIEGVTGGTKSVKELTQEELASVAQAAQMERAVESLAESIESSFSKAVSVVSEYGNASEVTSQQVLQHFADQVTAARNWSANLVELAKAGIEGGLLLELAQAGPKAAPLVAAILGAVREGNLDVINQAQADLRLIPEDLAVALLTARPELADAVRELGGAVSDEFDDTLQQVIDNTESAGDEIGDVIQRSWSARTMDGVGAFFDSIGPWWDNRWNEFKAHVGLQADTLGATFSNVGSGIATGFSSTMTFFKNLPGKVGGFLAELPSKAAFFLGQMIGTFAQAGLDLGRWAAEVIPNLVNNISTWVGELPGRVGTWLGETRTRFAIWGINTAREARVGAEKIITGIVDWFSKLPGRVWNWLVQLPGLVGNTFHNMMVTIVGWQQRLSNAVGNVVEAILDWFRRLPGRVVAYAKKLASEFIKGFLSKFTGSPKSIIEHELEDSLQRMLQNLKNSRRAFRSQMAQLGSEFRFGQFSLSPAPLPAFAGAANGSASPASASSPALNIETLNVTSVRPDEMAENIAEELSWMLTTSTR